LMYGVTFCELLLYEDEW